MLVVQLLSLVDNVLGVRGSSLFVRFRGVLHDGLLPQAWLFQILLGIISPFVDLLLVIQLVTAGLDYMQHGAQFDPTNLKVTLFYYAIFMLVDLATAVVAFLFERREDWRLLWWLVLQRFGYRQILYYVLVKSVSTAAKGHFVGWGKLDRKATVSQGTRP